MAYEILISGTVYDILSKESIGAVQHAIASHAGARRRYSIPFEDEKSARMLIEYLVQHKNRDCRIEGERAIDKLGLKSTMEAPPTKLQPRPEVLMVNPPKPGVKRPRDVGHAQGPNKTKIDGKGRTLYLATCECGEGIAQEYNISLSKSDEAYWQHVDRLVRAGVVYFGNNTLTVKEEVSEIDELATAL